MGLKKTFKKTINHLKDPKKLPGKAKDYLNHKKEEVKSTYRKYIKLKAKIKAGTATLKDKMDYRSYRNMLMQVPIQIALASPVTGGVGAAVGLGAAGVSAAAAAGSVGGFGLLGAGVASGGTTAGNEAIIKKLKRGEKLNALEKYRLRKADKIK